jgi:hypothetical protein
MVTKNTVNRVRGITKNNLLTAQQGFRPTEIFSLSSNVTFCTLHTTANKEKMIAKIFIDGSL